VAVAAIAMVAVSDGDGRESIVADQADPTDPADGVGSGSTEDDSYATDDPDEAGPDPVDEARPPMLLETAQAVGAETVVAASSGKVWAWTSEGDTNFDGLEGYLRSDGRFVYGVSTQTGEQVAATLDGTIVCRGERPIDHVTQRQDGSFVMAAEDPEPVGTDSPNQALAYPLFAVDCQTGEEQPIEPIHRIGPGEGDTVTIHRVGDHVFETLSDAEGNITELRAEAGPNLIGDDYLGLTVFGSDGRLLAFGDQQGSPSPHSTHTIGVRDLVTGQRLWGETLDGFVIDLWFVDERLVVATATDDPTLNQSTGTNHLIVFEATTGQHVTETDAPPDLLYLG
jgi:outer membrane protein assembly factor BamB